jgi:hypothetical protein
VAFAEAQLQGMKARADLSVTAEVLGEAGVRISISTHRTSFFLGLLPRGGFVTLVEATAEATNQAPLCILSFGTSAGQNIDVHQQAGILAQGCLVHANGSIYVSGQGLIQAGQVQVGKLSSGPIMPSPLVGAPDRGDPFTDLPLTPPSSCGALLNFDVGSNVTLDAGVHSLNIDVKSGGALTLGPGEHYFCGEFLMKNKARVSGEDVVLIFMDDAALDWKDGADVSLDGRKSGPLAGLVIATARSRTSDFAIETDPVSNITGTIYSPKAKLIVKGSKQAGQASDWTVLATTGVEATGGARLKINIDYSGSDVPVPGGVGNSVTGARLTN